MIVVGCSELVSMVGRCFETDLMRIGRCFESRLYCESVPFVPYSPSLVGPFVPSKSSESEPFVLSPVACKLSLPNVVSRPLGVVLQ